MPERYNLEEDGILNPEFSIADAVRRVARVGYLFAGNAITANVCQAMEEEVRQLSLEEGDHISQPINAGTSREVRQLHERAYLSIGDPEVPVATFVTGAIARQVQGLEAFPELAAWCPTEAGYQRYRSSDDMISPHRDRRTDKLLAVTITINGSNVVKIHESIDDPNDYSRLRQVDEYKTQPGSVMLLRASGLASGEQTIHEVLPPEQGSRLILNLRMRPDILAPPTTHK